MTSGYEVPADAAQVLNSAFYDQSPHEYFLLRLNGLLVQASGSQRYQRRLREGITVQSLTLRVNEGERTSAPVSESTLDSYVAAETEVLVHHLGESLILAFAAHEPDVAVPWLAMSTTDAAKLRQRYIPAILSTSDEDGLRALVAYVLLGSDEYPGPDGASGRTEAEWESVAENLRLFLQAFAQRLDLKGHLYNAAKHGFALKALDSTVTLSAEAKALTVSDTVPSLSYLERLKDPESGERRVLYTVTPANTVASWFLCFCGCHMLRAMWDIGAIRRLDAPSREGFRWWPMFKPESLRTENLQESRFSLEGVFQTPIEELGE